MFAPFTFYSFHAITSGRCMWSDVSLKICRSSSDGSEP